MGRREEIHKQIIETKLKIQEATLKVKENFLERRDIVNSILSKVKEDFFKDSEGKINETLFDLNAKQIASATKALQYIDTALKYLEKNNHKKAMSLMNSVNTEIHKISEIFNQMLKASHKDG